MPNSPDEPTYSPDQPEESEKTPQRETCKSIAKTQLDCLGYSALMVKVADFLKGKGAIADLNKALLHIFDTDDNDLNHMVGEMTCVPNSDEARKLLATAIFGEPAQRNADGTVIVTSYTLAEPSITTVQTKLPMLDNQNDKRRVPNIKGTDTLVRKLISDSGFQAEDKTAETVFHLKKGKPTTLIHPQNKSLTMEIASPVDSGDGKSSTAYSYHIQTILKSRPLS